MAMRGSRVIEIADPSGPAEARRVSAEVARAIGFDEADLGRIALIVTELCTNLVKHAQYGCALVTGARREGQPIFQVLTIDKGPGFAFAECLRDGHSTTGTPGGGLGAVDRQADAFDAYSARGMGSVLVAEVWARRQAPVRGGLLVAGVSVAKEGEDVCGDAWSTRRTSDGTLVLLADGIGHGPDAARAAREAVRTFEAGAERDPAAVVSRLHEALRSTRGATVGVAAVTPRTIRYAGVGNIAAAVVTGDATRHLASHNGTAGRDARRIQEFAYPWPERGVLVMASDGLATRWDLGAYPGLLSHHPAVVAGALYRDFARSRDDVTVVAGRTSGWQRSRGGAS
jgi:anti-sigma regulatory factor (Ser/Thr protein kinase)